MSDAHPPPSSPTPTNDDGGAAPDPWRTALLARAATAQNPGNYGAWATLGLAQAMMGNYSAAITAYRRAWDLDGGNPWYAHNLGHLLDVAAHQPDEALPLLLFAETLQPGEPDVVSSLAHVLGRCGDPEEGLRVLATASSRQDTAEHIALRRWLEQGAPRADPYEPGAGVKARSKLVTG